MIENPVDGEYTRNYKFLLKYFPSLEITFTMDKPLNIPIWEIGCSILNYRRLDIFFFQ